MSKFISVLIDHKRSRIILESKKKYELFTGLKDLDFYKKHNVYNIDEGKRFYDFIGDQGVLSFISEKFRNVLIENKITGWDSYPITIEGSNLKYFGLIINGRSGMTCKLDEDGDRVYGTVNVDLKTWDGSDIFWIKETGIIACNLKVRKLLEQARITNIEFEDLSKY